MKVLDWTETFGIYSKLILASVVSLDRTDMQEPSHAEVLHMVASCYYTISCLEGGYGPTSEKRTTSE